MQEITITDSDRKLILNYRYIVWTINSLNESIEWNQRHGLPVHSLADQADSLTRQLIRFEEIMQSLPDRLTRIVIRLRYAIGMNVPEISFLIDISAGTVMRKCKMILSPGI